MRGSQSPAASCPDDDACGVGRGAPGASSAVACALGASIVTIEGLTPAIAAPLTSAAWLANRDPGLEAVERALRDGRRD